MAEIFSFLTSELAVTYRTVQTSSVAALIMQKHQKCIFELTELTTPENIFYFSHTTQFGKYSLFHYMYFDIIYKRMGDNYLRNARAPV
jgi:hypothetical protein